MIADGLVSLLYCGFVPRAAARANLGLSLGGAYALHWVGMLLLGAALPLSVLVHGDPGDDVWRFFHALWRGDAEVLVTTSIVIAVVELAHLLLGLVLIGAAAHDEPLRDTYRHAQRTAWVHTGQLALAILACSTAAALVDYYLNASRQAWDAYHYQGVGTLTLRTWLAGHAEVIIIALGVSTFVWMVWGVLRAATLSRGVPPQDHPSICEYCGYNLSFIEAHERCPECGSDMCLSLANHRGPTPWTAGRWLRLWPWLACSWRAWFKPEGFFRSMRTTGGVVSALGFLTVCSLVSGLTTWLAFVVCVSAFMPRAPDAPEVSWVALVPAFTVAGIFLVVAGLAGSVIGVLVSRQEKRNGAGAALQVACYCGGLMPIWALVSIAVITTIIGFLMEAKYFRYSWLLVMAWLGLNAAFLAFYVAGVARRMKYVRYANT